MTGDMIQHELSQNTVGQAGFQSCNAESLDPIVRSLAETGENVANTTAAVLHFGLFLPMPGCSYRCTSGLPTVSGVFVQSGLAR